MHARHKCPELEVMFPECGVHTEVRDLQRLNTISAFSRKPTQAWDVESFCYVIDMASATSTEENARSMFVERGSAPPEPHPAKRRKVTQEFGLMRPGTDHGKPRFVGSSSGIHFVRTVYATLAKRSSVEGFRSKEEELTQDLVPGEDDQLEQQTPSTTAAPSPHFASTAFWTSDEVIDSVESVEETRPSFENLVHWTQSYFDHWHPFLPFLNAPLILGHFEQITVRGLDRLPKSQAVIVKALVSISLADARQATGPSYRVPHFLVFHDGDDVALNTNFAISQPSSLENLQALLAVQVYLVTSLKLNYASRLGGFILRMAFQLGLHRCPARYANFTPAECSMRQRVFWSAYCLERMLSQSLGLPLDIHDDDIDTCYPGEEVHQHGQKGINSAGTTLRLLVMTAKHARIRGLILELRNKSLPVRNDTLDKSIATQAELSRWINETQDTIDSLDASSAFSSNGDTTKASAITPAQRLIMKMLQYESEITLNRPGVTANAGTPAGLAALQNCIAASRSIISMLDEFRTAHTPQSSSLKMNPPLLWPLLTWSVWMSCFILAYAALEGYSSLSSARIHAIKTEKILQHLSLRRSTWPESCGTAVKHLMSALSEKCERLSNASEAQYTAPQKMSGHGRLTGDGSDSQQIMRNRRAQKSEANTNFDRNNATLSRGQSSEMLNAVQASSTSSNVERQDTNTAQINVGVTPLSAMTEPPPTEWPPTFFDLNNFDPFNAIDFSNFLTADQDMINNLYYLP